MAPFKRLPLRSINFSEKVINLQLLAASDAAGSVVVDNTFVYQALAHP